MPTLRTLTFALNASPDAIAALLRDPEFLRTRCEGLGERNVDVRIEDLGEQVRVEVARDRELAVPAFARRLIQSSGRIVDRQVWRRAGDGWRVEYTIDLGQLPGTVQGHSEYRAAPGGSRYTSTFEVTARVPVIGAKVEALVADRVEESIRANVERSEAHFAS